MNETIVALARDHGASLVGVAGAAAVADGPPSADPTYVLPTARSVFAYAVALDRDAIEAFITKRAWRPHCDDRKAVCRRVYAIGDAVADYLRGQGHDAVVVDANNNYRPEAGAADVTEMTEFHPEFSHRYAAVAAGIGRLGWSGNLMTREHGALVELGSVVTSAPLAPDKPISDDDHPCDRCRMCASVCPVEMVRPAEEMTVCVAGVVETISQKRPNTCCWIGCTGYEGLSKNKRWSNWSPYRLGSPLPAGKPELDQLCIALQKRDPQMADPGNVFADFRRHVFSDEWFYYTVCGFCRLVCSPNRTDRIANRKRIVESGVAALLMNGEHVVASPEEMREISTPFGLSVVVPADESTGRPPPERPDATLPDWPGQFPLDREVIRHLRTR